MKENIAQLARQITISKKAAWLTMLGVVVGHYLFLYLMSLLIPETSFSVVGAIALRLTPGLLGFMIITGCTWWASKILKLEHSGFVRALGATSLIQVILFALSAVISVSAALVAMVPGTLLFMAIVLLTYFPIAIFLSIFVFSTAYEITQKKALGLFAIANTFLFLILLASLLLLWLVVSHVSPELISI